MSFAIVTDNTADLPDSYYKEHNVYELDLKCIMDDVTYDNENKLDIAMFYDKLRAGSMPTTSQINPDEAKKFLEKILKEYDDVLVIAFSSGLSGTYQSFDLAARELVEENPLKRIMVIDSLCASLGEGLLVDKAVELRDMGQSLKYVATYLTNNRLHLCHVFTVNDLFHLYRGGRVSKATAVLGSMIDIKPLLHVDNEGHLTNVSKARGRKKSLISLVDMMEKRIGKYREEKQRIFISHSDCLEDAEFVKAEVERRFGYDTYLINYIGSVIGSHTGVGTVALFFWGEER